MAFVVVGNEQEIIAIERMLREICGGVSIDHASGAVTMVGPAPGDHSEGCDCIRALISSPHQVHIHPLSAPGDEIPGSGSGPDNPKKTIGHCSGGATVPSPLSKAQQNADGSHGEGADTDVYIDLSNNNKRGYPAPARSGGVRPPLWLILAHELTSGHAYHCVSGTIPHPTGNAQVDQAARENQAIDSENVHRRSHHIHERGLKHPHTEDDE